VKAGVSVKKNSGSYGAKNPGIILLLQKLSPNQQTRGTPLIIGINRKRRKRCS
jgi:hypothetical protein